VGASKLFSLQRLSKYLQAPAAGRGENYVQEA
jgi:uncharacterized pyridoxal phosphate-containing UPF0001 family protein